MKLAALCALAALAGCSFAAGSGRGAGHPPPETSVSRPSDAPGAKEERKVAFEGRLLLRAVDPAGTERQIRALAAEAQGWIARLDGSTITLRIPAARFHDVFDRAAALAPVLERSISAADVGEEFFDLRIRVDNAEQVRRRLQALLEKALHVQEALEVERELARLSEQIERMKGRLQRLADSVAYATIMVEMRTSVARGTGSAAPRFPFGWLRNLGLDDLMRF